LFAAVNAGLLILVGLRYLWYYAWLGPSVAWIYAGLALVSQMSVFAYLPFLVIVPVIMLVPQPRVVLPLGVLLGSTVLSLLVLDTLLFADNRYHLSVLTLMLLAPHTWAFLAVYFAAGLAIEAMLALWIWRRSEHAPSRRLGRYVALTAIACFGSSHLIHLWAQAHSYVPVTSFTRYLPLYFPLSDSRNVARLGLLNQAVLSRNLGAQLGRPPGGELRYPRAPLVCEPRPPLLNVLLIVIDAMRADALTAQSAPRMAEFAQGSLAFDAHYSGGDWSRPGMFSIFYGIPASYWDAFADDNRPPVLMDLFRRYGYELGLFTSTSVHSRAAALDRTALARIPNLRETHPPLSSSAKKDLTMTDDWLQWLDRRDPSRPFFGFLYYDAVVSNRPVTDFPAPPVPPGAPEQARAYASYLTKVGYVDALVGRVLDDLERRRLLERTVVIITSDHGMEFDELGQGFTGHGTSFSDYQVHTPFVLRWPGRAPGRVARRTSHNDLAPTLLGELFGCTNPPADYSSGHGLFSDAQWDWLIVLSFSDFALLEPDQVTIVYPSGNEVRDQHYRLIQHPRFSRDKLRAAFQEMSRFYR
jgi:membrane-anchored protein YejM (alkaline phosphatase superfamily)